MFCSVLSGGKLETMNYIIVYIWKEYKRRNYAFKNTYHILGILYFKYIFQNFGWDKTEMLFNCHSPFIHLSF